MEILSFKPGHDGTIAFIDDFKLIFSLEAEKDSFLRYASISPSLVLNSMSYLNKIPNVLAIGGWWKVPSDLIETPLEAGYFGFNETGILTKKISFLGKEVELFSSTHERSHLLCAYGMSPFDQGEPCYALVWEGKIGSFYEIDQNVKITKCGEVLDAPGNKYAFLFSVGDSTLPMDRPNDGNAGKLMALASFSDRSPFTKDEQKLINFIFNRKQIYVSTQKEDLRWSPYLNMGVEHQAFKNLAGKFSDALFEKFYSFAKTRLNKKLPLLISGGCGLNCDWNTKWKESGLFSDIFIPPCTNDTGSAVGTAIDAQLYYTGKAKISWNVYAGEYFIDDMVCLDDFEIFSLEYQQVAELLKQDKVIAWVNGKYEIGPRALGNRSILASPFKEKMRDRLNEIKQREGYRPIAPICIEEDVSEYFEWNEPSPYMLYFQRLNTDKLKAVTHIDNSARLQSVNERENPEIYRLLVEFKKLTGFGVLCNTSLNFQKRGFINRMSDLVKFCLNRDIDAFVVNKMLYLPKT